jgi:hypothetical protein
MMSWKRERKKERRKLKGLRRGPDGVIPPSLGKRYVELTEEHFYGFETLIEFIKETEGVRLHSLGDRFVLRRFGPQERLEQAFRIGGLNALAKLRFPQGFLLELNDDDVTEVHFRLLF